MHVENSNYIFFNRDDNFDLCRSFLVVSMIFTHVFQNFFLPDYNRRLTFFVTIGFVLISGFVIGGKNSRKVGRIPFDYLTLYLRRCYKIFLLYFICNIPILIFEPYRMDLLFEAGFIQLFLMVILGTSSAIFGFDILPAIALTTLFAWILMAVGNQLGSKAFLFSLFSLVILFLFEKNVGENYITLRLLLVGIFGCLLGKAASTINWINFIEKLSTKTSIFILATSVCFYFLLIYFHHWPRDMILLWRHVLPTSLLLLFVYVLSNALRLNSYRIVKFLNATLGEYLLFAYIFHIGLIKITRLFIPSELNLIETIMFSLIFSIITIGTCYLLDQGRKRVALLSRVYSVMFGL